MKLRTAYFCRKCNEEIDLEKCQVNWDSNKRRKCPHCGYEPAWGRTSVVYEWKVEVKPTFKRVGVTK